MLGALSPEERREFEEHLAGCPACRSAWPSSPGMPGLLARWHPRTRRCWSAAPVAGAPRRPAGHLDAPDDHRDPAATPAELAALVGGRGAVVLCSAGSGWASAGRRTRRTGWPSAPVAPSSMTALVDLVQRAEGTRIRVECQYGEFSRPDERRCLRRVLDLRRRPDRRGADVKDWTAKPNKVMRPEGRPRCPETRSNGSRSAGPTPVRRCCRPTCADAGKAAAGGCPRIDACSAQARCSGPGTCSGSSSL